MEQVFGNGSNQSFQTLPAGFAARVVAGGVDVNLTSSEGAADLIELTGLLTGNIRVTIPTPLITQIIGTSGGADFKVGLSWMKLIRNSTTGSFTVTVVGPAGGSGIVLTQGEAQWLYSRDGKTAQPGSARQRSAAWVQPEWLQADWWIDWLGGNDTNDGKTAATAVKTVMSGVVSKWGTTKPTLQQNTTLHIMSDQPLNVESIVLEPNCNGFRFNIFQVPVVVGDPHRLGTNVVLAGLIAKNRTTAQRLTITLDKNYPGGTIVVNTTHVSTAKIDTMAGNVATMCQPVSNEYGTVVDTWTNGDVVNVNAPTVLNIQRYVLTGAAFDAVTSAYSLIVGILAPDPNGVLQNGMITVGVDTEVAAFKDCSFVSPVAVASGAGTILFTNCWQDPNYTMVAIGATTILGGRWPYSSFLSVTPSTNVVDCDASVDRIYGYVSVGTAYIGIVLVAGSYTQGIVSSVAEGYITNLAFIWGPGAMRSAYGGKFILRSNVLTWAPALLLTGGLTIDSLAVGSTFNPATGAWSVGTVALNPAALDAAPGKAIFNPTSGCGFYSSKSI